MNQKLRTAGAPFQSYLVLSVNPAVIYVKDYLLRNRKSLFGLLLESLRFKPVTLIIGLSWCHQNNYLIKSLKGLIASCQIRFPHYRFIILTNTPKEDEFLHEAGLETVFCNQNGFLDERLYFPTGEAKKYDAIYDAALAPFKRHELARKINRLALISYVKPDVTIEETRRIAHENQHAVWLNDPLDNSSSWLSDVEINHLLNQAKVGLCLSAVEGAMYASAQYLLAGLPVVTTKNKGGRDELLDPAYTRWVEDDPSAVAAAVDELAGLNLDPHTIRRETLKKFSIHRNVFTDLMNGITRETTGGPWATQWPANLPNRLYSDHIPFHRTLMSLHLGGRPAPWTSAT